jgi:hypothetical protein
MGSCLVGLRLIFKSPSIAVLSNSDNLTVSPREGLVLCEGGGQTPSLRAAEPPMDVSPIARHCCPTIANGPERLIALTVRRRSSTSRMMAALVRPETSVTPLPSEDRGRPVSCDGTASRIGRLPDRPTSYAKRSPPARSQNTGYVFWADATMVGWYSRPPCRHSSKNRCGSAGKAS